MTRDCSAKILIGTVGESAKYAAHDFYTVLRLTMQWLITGEFYYIPPMTGDRCYIAA
jgi:hypothetical protein